MDYKDSIIIVNNFMGDHMGDYFSTDHTNTIKECLSMMMVSIDKMMVSDQENTSWDLIITTLGYFKYKLVYDQSNDDFLEYVRCYLIIMMNYNNNLINTNDGIKLEIDCLLLMIRMNTTIMKCNKSLKINNDIMKRMTNWRPPAYDLAVMY